MSFLIWSLLGLFVILQVADVYLTYQYLKEEKGTEWSPIARAFMNKFGVLPGLGLLKGVTTAALFFIAWYFSSYLEVKLGLAICCGGMGYAVYHNYRILKGGS